MQWVIPPLISKSLSKYSLEFCIEKIQWCCDVTIGIAKLHLVGCNTHKYPLKTTGLRHVKDEKNHHPISQGAKSWKWQTKG